MCNLILHERTISDPSLLSFDSDSDTSVESLLLFISIHIDNNIEVRQVDIRPVCFGQSLSRMTHTPIAVNDDVVKGCYMGLGCEERVCDEMIVVMPNFVQLFLIYFKSHSARNREAKNRLTTLKRSR
jgi:hypothetical protein